MEITKDTEVPREASRSYVRWMTGTSQASPTDDFGGPLGKGVLSATAESNTDVPVACRTSSTLQHHSPGGCLSGDCDLQADTDGFLAGVIWYTTTMTMPDPFSEKSSAPPRGEGASAAGVQKDLFGIPNPRESGSVIGADRRRSGPPCV